VALVTPPDSGVVGRTEDVAREASGLPRMILRRVLYGVLTIWLVSLLVFAATQLLPGNAASAVLQNTATPERVHALESRLHLDDPAPVQYLRWIGGLVRGDPGTSLSSGEPILDSVRPRLQNSLVLVVAAGFVGSALAVGLGILIASRRDSVADHAMNTTSLSIAALPEFVVAVVLVILFSTTVFKVLPGVSIVPPGEWALSRPRALVLPVATLSLVIFPYIFRMSRAAMIDAMESDYVESAELHGISRSRILLRHALPNALGPITQVIGLSLIYLAGGIVVVEAVFNFAGVGQGLVDAVSNRDIPTIQFLVMVLASFYVAINIATDVIVLVATPRHRLQRSA
jgi:peptide/nickel transport system permease protein